MRIPDDFHTPWMCLHATCMPIARALYPTCLPIAHSMYATCSCLMRDLLVPYSRLARAFTDSTNSTLKIAPGVDNLLIT